jgi:hypothetical protein
LGVTEDESAGSERHDDEEPDRRDESNPSASSSAASTSSADAFSTQIGKALAPHIENAFRAVLPSQDRIARILRHAVGPEIAKIGLLRLDTALRPTSTRALLATGTEEFLRNIQFQVPSFEATRLHSHRVGAALARMSEWFARIVPPNLRGLKIAEWERLFDISEEQRIGVLWLPRADVLRQLLDAATVDDRAMILQMRSDDILADCVESLHETTHVALAELVDFAQDAIETHLAGYTSASQALATNVLDTALEQHHVSGVKGMLAACKRLEAKDEETTTLLEMRLRLATAGIPRSYRDYKYHQRDPRYSRNGTAHAVNGALYTPCNSLRAITLATSWLRWLQETWSEAEAA